MRVATTQGRTVNVCRLQLVRAPGGPFRAAGIGGRGRVRLRGLRGGRHRLGWTAADHDRIGAGLKPAPMSKVIEGSAGWDCKGLADAGCSAPAYLEVSSVGLRCAMHGLTELRRDG
jgi:hypothetical protein